MNILLVDDQPEVREAVRMLLEFDEHAVTEAGGGREALELLAARSFDLVMTDYAMPGMKGDELAATIKQRNPSQLILMVTGSVDRAAASKYAVDGYLGKPFTMDDLRQAVAEVKSPAGHSLAA